MKFNGQSGQDAFVLKSLGYKTNGFFLEIGSNDPININNTYLLESEYNWKGIMIEYDGKFENSYIRERPNSKYVIRDATKINFLKLFEECNAPKNIDYLQIDLEAENGSTLQTLKNLDAQVMDNYKFAVITFEHDIYRGNEYETRKISREIFSKRGYVLVFPDVKNGGNAYEDWYYHPDLIDISLINKVKKDESLDWKDIINLF